MAQDGQTVYDLVRRWDGESRLFLPIQSTPRREFASLEEVSSEVKRYSKAIADLVDTDSDESFERLLEITLATNFPLLYRHISLLPEKKNWRSLELRERARWLVKNARDESHAQLGIFLVGLSGTEEDVADVKILSRHDNLAEMGIDAVASLLDDPADFFLEAAKQSQYGTREDLVWKLLDCCEDRPDIQEWLLLGGWDSQMGYDAAALACIKKVNFHDFISTVNDPETLDAACRLLCASMSRKELFCGWSDGRKSVEKILDILAERTEHTGPQLDFVSHLIDWLDGAPGRSVFANKYSASVEKMPENGWACDICESIAEMGRAFLSRADVQNEILSSSDMFCQLETCKKSGLDQWEKAFAQLKREPENWSLAVGVLDTNDEGRLELVHRLFEGLRIGDLITSENFTAVLMRMQKSGPVSEEIIEICLLSASGRAIFQALKVLEDRKDRQWSDQLWNVVQGLQLGDMAKSVKFHLPFVYSRLKG